jgi:endonuclease-3
VSDWTPPRRERIERIREILREYYGRPVNDPHRAPIDELVLTVLSQNTNDRNRDVAFNRLRERFPDWYAVADAPVAEIEEAIKPGGISKVKSKRIQEILRKIRDDAGSLDIAFLETVKRERALEFLESLPGVGRKTAACVLLFSYGRAEMPVDTHVYRVSSRLGLIRPKASFELAHDEWLELAPADELYELHVNLLRHGRRICASQRPRCEICPLKRLCPHGKQVLAERKTARARPKAKPKAKPTGSKRKPAKSKPGGRRR